MRYIRQEWQREGDKSSIRGEVGNTFDAVCCSYSNARCRMRVRVCHLLLASQHSTAQRNMDFSFSTDCSTLFCVDISYSDAVRIHLSITKYMPCRVLESNRETLHARVRANPLRIDSPVRCSVMCVVFCSLVCMSPHSNCWTLLFRKQNNSATAYCSVRWLGLIAVDT